MRSGFFNSEIIGYDAENMPVFDRAEEASFFAKYFSQFISNGIFPNPSTNMQVLAVEGMKVRVDIGVCYINGYMGWVEPAEVLELEESDLQSRIDRIVARLDFTDRSIKLFVKKGEALGNPIPPELQRDYDIYEIGLADILIDANAIEVTQEKITDLRLNTEFCGIVANQLQHVDTTTLFNQYQDWLKRVTKEGELDLQRLKQNFSNSFNMWFSELQHVLDGDVAGNLYNLIQTNIPRRKSITLSAAGWVLNETTGKYEYRIDDTTITEDDDIDVRIEDEEQEEALADAETRLYTYNGYYVFFAKELLEVDIEAEIIITRTKLDAGEANNNAS